MNNDHYSLSSFHLSRVDFGVLFVIEWLRQMELLDFKIKQQQTMKKQSESVAGASSVWNISVDLFQHTDWANTTDKFFSFQNSVAGTLKPGACMFFVEELVQIPSVSQFYAYCHQYSSIKDIQFSARIDTHLLNEYKQRIIEKYGEQNLSEFNIPLEQTHSEIPVYQMSQYETDVYMCNRIISRFIRNFAIIHLISCMQQDASSSSSSTKINKITVLGKSIKTKKEQKESAPVYKPILEEEQIILTHMQQTLALIYLIEKNYHNDQVALAVDSWKKQLHTLVTDTLLKSLSWFNDRTRQYMQQNGYSIESCIKDCFQWISMHLQLIKQSSSWVTREQRLLRAAQLKQIKQFVEKLESHDFELLFVKSIKKGSIGALKLAFLIYENKPKSIEQIYGQNEYLQSFDFFSIK
jgi:hypothetical protein